jgi:hypothetical protein
LSKARGAHSKKEEDETLMGPYDMDELLTKARQLYPALVNPSGKLSNAVALRAMHLHQPNGPIGDSKALSLKCLLTDLRLPEYLVHKDNDEPVCHPYGQLVYKGRTVKEIGCFQSLCCAPSLAVRMITSEEMGPGGKNTAAYRKKDSPNRLLGLKQSVPEEGLFREWLDAFALAFGSWRSLAKGEDLWGSTLYQELVRTLQKAFDAVVHLCQYQPEDYAKMVNEETGWNQFVALILDADKIIAKLIWRDLKEGQSGFLDKVKGKSLRIATSQLSALFQANLLARLPTATHQHRQNPHVDFPEWQGAFAEEWKDLFSRRGDCEEVDYGFSDDEDDDDAEAVPSTRQRRDREEDGPDRLPKAMYLKLGWSKKDVLFNSQDRCWEVRNKVYKDPANTKRYKRTEEAKELLK